MLERSAGRHCDASPGFQRLQLRRGERHRVVVSSLSLDAVGLVGFGVEIGCGDRERMSVIAGYRRTARCALISAFARARALAVVVIVTAATRLQQERNGASSRRAEESFAGHLHQIGLPNVRR